MPSELWQLNKGLRINVLILFTKFLWFKESSPKRLDKSSTNSVVELGSQHLLKDGSSIVICR